ncbi:MAG: glycoside hydrolase family 3 C-terminal domain-containing protein [Tannerellaceae bacterium]|nr:glycoside hydrolase family 3 C-terminal domain-containing protein [Tannerellaceae bacterium]
MNQNLDVNQRVSDLIERLTLRQKAQLLNHRGTTVTVDGFSIRADQWNQCLHGVKWTEPTTVFPTSIALGATWNPGLIHRVATVISDEARAIYNGWKINPQFKGEHKGLIYRSPVINISRNPYWGRINEIYSEDPYLTGQIGMAFVRGLQGNDPKHLKLASTLKHYAVNNVEVDRMELSAEVEDRMLFEYWLPHFRDCVVEAKAQSLMASYNAINGTPNNINRVLLTDILKDRWGHEGFVVSDLGGVRTMVEGHEKGAMTYPEAVGKSIMAGCDFSDSEFEQYIPEALYSGYLTEERLNDALRRVLTVRMRLGEFDEFSSVSYSKISPDTIMANAHRKLSLLTARESVVLLKNDGILPLDKNKLKKLAVIGPYSDLFNHGNYGGIPMNPVKPLQGIINELGSSVEVIYEKGGEISFPRVRKGFIPPAVDRAAEIGKAVEAAKKCDAAILFIGTNTDVEIEGIDRETLNLSGNQQQLMDAVMAANPNTVVVLMSAGPLAVPSAKKHAAAILQGWWPGEEGGTAIASVLFGKYNPAGRLPYTMYESDAQVPPIDIYDISKGFTYMYVKGKPQYAFGHGLSYTKFDYSNLKLSKKEVAAGDAVRIDVDIRNTGKRDGDEVVQLYVRDLNKGYIHPASELRGFRRVSIASGETGTVSMELPVSSLAYYDTAIGDFRVIPGKYELLIGSASDNIKLKSVITIK